MEKAKLTQKQAAAINEHLEFMYDDQIMDSYVGSSFPKTMTWGVIQSMHPALLARALYVGIEVLEPDETVVIEGVRKAELKEFYEQEEVNEFERGRSAGIRLALEKLGIKVKGINVH